MESIKDVLIQKDIFNKIKDTELFTKQQLNNPGQQTLQEKVRIGKLYRENNIISKMRHLQFMLRVSF